MNFFLSYFWSRFFSHPEQLTSLGCEFKKARKLKGLSIGEVALALHFSEDLIVSLEEDRFSIEPGYGRLIAVRYARFLGIELSKIHVLLPAVAPLQYPGQTLIRNMSRLKPKLRARQFLRQQALTYSIRPVMVSLQKLVLVVLGVIILFYIWSALRHLARVM